MLAGAGGLRCPGCTTRLGLSRGTELPKSDSPYTWSQLGNWDNLNYYLVLKALWLRHLRPRTGGSIVLPFSPLVCGRGPGGEERYSSSPRPYSGEGPGVRAVHPLPPSPLFPLRLLPSPLRCSPFPTYSSRSAVMPPCFSTRGGSSIYHDKRYPSRSSEKKCETESTVTNGA